MKSYIAAYAEKKTALLNLNRKIGCEAGSLLGVCSTSLWAYVASVLRLTAAGICWLEAWTP